MLQNQAPVTSLTVRSRGQKQQAVFTLRASRCGAPYLGVRPSTENMVPQMPRLTLPIAFTLACASFTTVACAATCPPDLNSQVTTAYNAFRSASRAGDLAQVKALSSLAVAAQITDFEKNSNNPSALARQMSSVMPVLAAATKIACEYSGKKARIIITTETASQSGQRVPVSSVVMFESVPGRGWLVGDKTMTSPFSAQPVSEILKHEALQLP